MSKAGERLIKSATEASRTCWSCFNTGVIVDLVWVSKHESRPGPDAGKPCPCGRAPNPQQQE